MLNTSYSSAYLSEGKFKRYTRIIRTEYFEKE